MAPGSRPERADPPSPPRPSSLWPGQGQRQGRPRRAQLPRAGAAPPPPQPGAEAPDHPTSFPLQFYQRLGSQAGDRRPALTRISPQIARYSSARLPRARRPRLSFVSAWPRSLGFLQRPPRRRDILLHQTEASWLPGLAPQQGRAGQVTWHGGKGGIGGVGSLTPSSPAALPAAQGQAATNWEEGPSRGLTGFRHAILLDPRKNLGE